MLTKVTSSFSCVTRCGELHPPVWEDRPVPVWKKFRQAGGPETEDSVRDREQVRTGEEGQHVYSLSFICLMNIKFNTHTHTLYRNDLIRQFFVHFVSYSYTHDILTSAAAEPTGGVDTSVVSTLHGHSWQRKGNCNPNALNHHHFTSNCIKCSNTETLNQFCHVQ